MVWKINAYHRPETLEEAVSLVESGAVPLYGGASLFQMRGAARVEAVVDLSRLGLDKVNAVEGGFEAGSMVTLQSALDGELSTIWAGGMALALTRAYTWPMRNAWTLGEVVARAEGANPLLTVLLAGGARVNFADGESVNLTAFWDGEAASGGIITSLTLEAPEAPVVYKQVSLTPAAPPIVCVAGRVRGIGIQLAIGGIGPAPVFVDNAHKVMDIEVSDWYGSDDYRAEMVETLSRRVLNEVVAR